METQSVRRFIDSDLNRFAATADDHQWAFSGRLIVLSRVLSLIVAATYVVIVYHSNGTGAAFELGLGLILPLVLIWFSEAMGSYTGFIGFQHVSQASPSWAIAFLGWFILLIPAVMALAGSMGGT